MSPALAASAKRVDSSVGSGAPAFGGRELRRRARTVRPPARFSASSDSQVRCSCSTRRASASRSWSARGRVTSSRASRSAATTTARRSVSATSSTSARAASALSCHSAARRRGSSCSAIETMPSALISGVPAARACSFCLSTAWRTAGMPPRSTCSAIGFCSSGSEASTSARWARPARSRLALGRGSGVGRAGRSRRGARAARSDAGRLEDRSPSRAPLRLGRLLPSPLGGRSPRSRRGGRSLRSPRSRGGRRRSPSPRRFEREPGANTVVTSCSSRGGPMSSMRSGSRRASLGGSTEVTVMPSTSKSASARTTSPTFEPDGQQATVELALRLAGPGGAPGPRAVVTAARQLDLDAPGHGQRRYRSRSRRGECPSVLSLGHDDPRRHPAGQPPGRGRVPLRRRR